MADDYILANTYLDIFYNKFKFDLVLKLSNNLYPNIFILWVLNGRKYIYKNEFSYWKKNNWTYFNIFCLVQARFDNKPQVIGSK